MMMLLALQLVRGNFVCASTVHARARVAQARARGAVFGRGNRINPPLGE